MKSKSLLFPKAKTIQHWKNDIKWLDISEAKGMKGKIVEDVHSWSNNFILAELCFCGPCSSVSRSIQSNNNFEKKG